LNAGLGVALVGMLQILRFETRMLGNSRQHLWPDLLAVVEGENEIRPAIAGERPM
jgi:hypothetical protein